MNHIARAAPGATTSLYDLFVRGLYKLGVAILVLTAKEVRVVGWSGWPEKTNG